MPQPLESRVAYVREEGDPYEVEQAYRQHQHWLIAFLRRRFGQQDAEDLAQETYARAVTAKARIRNPRAFLARVALNAARDLLRRRAVRPQLTREDAGPPPAMAGAQDETLLLKQIIFALPLKLQEVFVLSRFAGLTYDEIAEHCGISVKTVEGRMTKALALCSALMDESAARHERSSCP